jgi:hypothetical protein
LTWGATSQFYGPPAGDAYCDEHGGKPMAAGYAYNSGTSSDFLSIAQLRDLIRKHVDLAFEIS